MKPTLLAKGIAACVVIVVYVGIAGAVLEKERSQLLNYAIDLERVYAEENALTKASFAISNSMLKWQEKLLGTEVVPTLKEQILLDIELVSANIQRLKYFQPQLAGEIEKLNQDISQLRYGLVPEKMLELQGHGRDLSQQLNEATRQVWVRKETLWNQYRTAYDTITETAVSLATVGVGLFGLTVMLFLTQMAWDIKNLSVRALEIVSGYRGAPVKVTRRDEIGELMTAVNQMQIELRTREQQLEISREQHYYKEKMAAIGSLASAVAHEINNPIAAIAGIAESMKELDGKSNDGEENLKLVDLILEHSRRITTISHQIGEFTQHQSPVMELLDLNTLVRNTCSFIGYDKRFQHIELTLQLDPQMPAITAIADHLIQVLMNLLINAADALENLNDRKPGIQVLTQAADREIVIGVKDNGRGMDAGTLSHVFEKSFTTKPPDRGRGLGLFLCKSLLEEGGNLIELESSVNVGTVARIRLMNALQQTGD